MNIFPVSFLTLAFGITLTACSSAPVDQHPPQQTAPGDASRPVLSAAEAKNFVPARYFAALSPDAASWQPSAISLPAQPNFVVGPQGEYGVTHTTLQQAVDAAIAKHSNARQYIAVLPGRYQGTVYVPAASGSLTIFGAGALAIDVKIGFTLDSEMDIASWRRLVNPAGKYMPGKPAWYMFDSCQRRRSATVGVMCSAVFWSQNNGLQLQNLTIENNLGDSPDAGNHQAVALRSDGDRTQINNVNILGRQNTFFLSNSDIHNQLSDHRQPRTLVTNSYLEGDVDIVAGRGAAVFENTVFRVVNSRTRQGAWVFAPATLSDVPYGFLAINSHFIAPDDGAAQLGRSLDVDSQSNGQLVIRDSLIDGGFNTAHPWGAAVVSGRPFTGNTGTMDDQGNIQRNLNDPRFNRMWEYNNRDADSKVVAD